MDRHSLQRARFVRPSEVPFRLRQQWVRYTDRWWRPPPTPPGPSPRWPGPHPPRPIARWIEPGWPDLPAASLDLLGTTLDPRTAWSSTRLQTASVDDALGWLTRNPPGHGIGWASAMEVALRAVSVVRLATEAPGPAWRPALHAHAAWIARHPSRGTSANNHRVAELAALAFAATVAPDLPDAPRWAAEARRELPGVLRAQLHPDGSGVEQSTHYLAYDLEWAALARRCGVDDLDEPIARACRFLAALCDAAGHAVALGDDDDGVVLVGGDDPVRSVLGACGLGVPGYRPDARAALLGAPLPSPFVHRPTTFPDGGVTVLRTEALQVVFDHGPLGGATLAAHGHADALATYVHDRVGPVVVGRGTGGYVGAPDVRRFHRGTAAHPTVGIDGADQSAPADHPFLWRTRARATLREARPDEGWAVAHHDGYAGRGVVHRRTVRVDGSVLTWIDALDGAGLHHVAVTLPLAPGLTVDADRQVWDGARRVGRIDLDPRLRWEVITGGPRPGPGWHAPAYGVWVAATTVRGVAVVRVPVTLEGRIDLR